MSSKPLFHWSAVFGVWLSAVLIAVTGISLMSVTSPEAKNIGTLLLLASLPFLMASVFLGLCAGKQD